MIYRAIEPGAPTPNYVAPGALRHSGEVAAPHPSGAIADVALGGTDGRVATAGVAGMEPPTQEPWGFGYARARPYGAASGALTLLVSDPAGFTVRQQDAVRRDMSDLLGDMAGYAPAPFAGADPLTGQLVGGFAPATIRGAD